MNYPIKRTPEQGHTKACLAKALTTVLENWRDDSSVTDLDFRLHLQNNGPLDEVDSYLRAGITECVCPPLLLQRYEVTVVTKRGEEKSLQIDALSDADAELVAVRDGGAAEVLSIELQGAAQ